MTTAIGLVMTDHIVAGRLEEQRLAGKTLRYPLDPGEHDALAAIPAGELVEILAAQIDALAPRDQGLVDAIGIAGAGIVGAGVGEEPRCGVTGPAIGPTQCFAWAARGARFVGIEGRRVEIGTKGLGALGVDEHRLEGDEDG